jgi:hypothetical protein
MTQDDDDHYRAFSWSDLSTILTAAVFGLAFLAGLIWVLVTNDPWHDFVPGVKGGQQQETPGVVPVTLPEKQ